MSTTMADVEVGADGTIRLSDEVRAALDIRSGDTISLRVDVQHRELILTPKIDFRTLIGSVKTAVRGVRIEDMDPGSGPVPYQHMVAPEQD